VVTDVLEREGVTVEMVRLVDHDIRPGVSSDEGDGDEWPAIRARILSSHILVMASPTWLGQPSSIAQRALERMDAMLSEEDDEGRPVAYNRVAGFVVTGNEDGGPPRDRGDGRPADRHRLHGPRTGVDLLEHGPRTRPVIPRDRPQARLVQRDRRSGRGEPACRGAGARADTDPAEELSAAALQNPSQYGLIG
jgi:hypothetical protein